MGCCGGWARNGQSRPLTRSVIAPRVLRSTSGTFGRGRQCARDGRIHGVAGRVAAHPRCCFVGRHPGARPQASHRYRHQVRGRSAPSARTSVIRAHAVLASILDLAVTDRRLGRTPTRELNVPRKIRSRTTTSRPDGRAPRCSRWGSNPHLGDFKSPASANWATGACGTRYLRPQPRRDATIGSKNAPNGTDCVISASSEDAERYTFGREANFSNSARGVSRAGMPTRSRCSKKLRIQLPKTRILRSQNGIARP
ncbi:hypothetical protein BH10ACT6_BH10ACT6_09250 [soil metagenome]